MLRAYTFPVDVSCGACLPHVESLIHDTGLQVINIQTDILKKTTCVQVKSDQDTEEILRNALRDGGRLIEDEQTNPELAPDPTLPSTPPSIRKLPRWLRWLLGGIGIASGVAMLALMLSGIGLPFAVMAALGGISAGLSFALGFPTIISAIRHLKNGAFNMDTLYALGGVAAIVITILHLFVPGLPMMFDAALFIFGFKHIGDAIKESITSTTTNDTNFSKRAPIFAIVEPSLNPVSLERIKVGNIICVRRGDIIPINGIVLDDDVSVFTTLINGKTTSTIYKKDQEALAGLRVTENNTNEFVRIQTTRNVQDSYLSQLDKQLALTKQHAPQIMLASDNILRWFIPAVIGIALLAAIIMTACFFPALGLLGAIAIGAKCLIAVLVSACPCTIGLVTPLAIKTGIDKAKQHHVLFKDEKKLQAAAQVNTLVFDLNGTLTTGKPIVSSFYTNKNREKILSYALALESQSPHAFANTIREYCASQLPIPTQHAISAVARSRTGISGTIDNKRIGIGNADLMVHEKINIEHYHTHNPVNISDIQQLVYLTVDGEIVGHFVLEDPPRSGAKATINQLKSQGYDIHLCTGADEKTAEAYARKFNIAHVYANCQNIADDARIRTKTAYIRSLQDQGKIVAMIGDGGNDAIPMMTSHLGVAVKSASSDEITRDLAGVEIDSDALTPVVALFEVAKQTVSNIKQTIIASLSLNSLCIAAAIVGTALTTLGFIFPPAIGAGLMVLLLVPVLVNVHRFKQQSLPDYEKAKAQAASHEFVGTTVKVNSTLEAESIAVESQNPAWLKTLDPGIRRDDSLRRDDGLCRDDSLRRDDNPTKFVLGPQCGI